MSHKQFLETKCELCSSVTSVVIPDYSPSRDAEYKKTFDPPKGWVDISPAINVVQQHVCKDCVDRIISERAKAVGFEKVEAVKAQTVSIADLMGDES